MGEFLRVVNVSAVRWGYGLEGSNDSVGRATLQSRSTRVRKDRGDMARSWRRAERDTGLDDRQDEKMMSMERDGE
jgi:hypothetical protein